MGKILKVIGVLAVVTVLIFTQVPKVETSAAPQSDFQMDKGTLVKYVGTATAVSIPDYVKIIGSEAFAGNSALTAVSLGENVKEIEYGAFKDCAYLNKIILSDSLKTIGNAAFSNTAIKTITLPANLEELGSGVFAGCDGLKEILVDKDNPNFVFDKYVLYNADKSLIYCYVPGAETEKFTMPASVTSIDEYAFWGNTNLEEIVLSTSLREIPDYAFSYCSRLDGIAIPYSVKSISNKAFENCIYMEDVTIPPSVSYIHTSAFDGCPFLKVTASPGTAGYDFYENWKLQQQMTLSGNGMNGNTLIEKNGKIYIVGASGKLEEISKDKYDKLDAESYTSLHDPSNVDYVPASDPMLEQEEGLLGQVMVVGQKAVILMENFGEVITGGGN